jgi:biopolymer transport protein ExbD
VLVLAGLTIAACSSKQDSPPLPEPKPADPKKPATKPVDKPPSVGSDGCEVAVMVLADGHVTFDGGGVKGATRLADIDFTALKPTVGKCSASLWAEDTVTYQDVIATMDSLIKIGLIDVGLGPPGDDSTPSPRPAKPPPDKDVKSTWTVTPEGRLEVALELARQKPLDKKARLAEAPVIIATKTEVTIAGKRVGKVDDAALDTAITGALPAHPKDGLAILQADASLRFSTIRSAVKGAKAAGYDNLLFAVKNSSHGQP